MVFVAGSGRSGTSTMAGVLRQLGLYVPQPEVVADNTNPLGFGEPQWVVDFHNALLSRARVHASDARPGAWDIVAKTVTDVVRTGLDDWVTEQFAAAASVGTTELVVKDPRVSWFLPTWIEAAGRADARACVATMLRPPAEVVASKSHSLLRRPDGRQQPHRCLGEHDAQDRVHDAGHAAGVRALSRPP